MANCHNLFIEFNKSIRLSKTKKDSLRTSRNALREKIKADFKSDKDYSPIFKGQGSFTLDTIVNPINTGDYDIDDGVYFEVETAPSDNPSQFHSWIYNAVEGHTDNIVDKNPCVRVIFSDGHHVDLTIYYIIGTNHPNLAHKKKGWIESDPKEFVNWFNDKLDDEKQLRRLVRYIKAWSDYKNVSGVSGLVLTILTAENYAQDERDDVALLNTLKAIQSKLKSSFSCYRPTTPMYEDLLTECSETNKTAFLSALSNLITSGEKAINESVQSEACLKWKKHFGDRFPCNLAKADLSDATKYGATPILKDDGRSA